MRNGTNPGFGARIKEITSSMVYLGTLKPWLLARQGRSRQGTAGKWVVSLAEEPAERGLLPMAKEVFGAAGPPAKSLTVGSTAGRVVGPRAGARFAAQKEICGEAKKLKSKDPTQQQ